MIHRIGVLAGLMALIAGANWVVVPASATAVRCGPARAHTLAGSGDARLYVVDGTVYGCSIHGHARYTIGRRGSCLEAACVESPTVAGKLAGYGLEECGVDTCSSQVVVRRLTDGARLRVMPTTIGPLGVESFQSVGSLVLKSDGAVAWIGLGSSIGGNRRIVEVHRANAGAAPSLLDSDRTISTGSLRLHDSKLTWRRGARTITARLV